MVSHFQAIANVALSFSSIKTEATALVAFVLLLLLTCAQAGLVGFFIWHRLATATSLWKLLLVGSQACLSSHVAFGLQADARRPLVHMPTPCSKEALLHLKQSY